MRQGAKGRELRLGKRVLLTPNLWHVLGRKRGEWEIWKIWHNLFENHNRDVRSKDTGAPNFHPFCLSPWTAITKHYGTGGLSNRNLSSYTSEAVSPRSKCWALWYLRRPLSSCRWLSSYALICPFLCVSTFPSGSFCVLYSPLL